MRHLDSYDFWILDSEPRIQNLDFRQHSLVRETHHILGDNNYEKFADSMILNPEF